jgi:hypothetical protein
MGAFRSCFLQYDERDNVAVIVRDCNVRAVRIQAGLFYVQLGLALRVVQYLDVSQVHLRGDARAQRLQRGLLRREPASQVTDMARLSEICAK